jgi:AraC family transcriptional regulator, regulatory protein of adaptative response / methylphosphotriester-DNA alkyltransferase methyltransferase
MNRESLPPVVSARKRELATDYVKVLEQHINDLRKGIAKRALHIKDLAALLHVHPVHLSNTIKEVTGKSTCQLYEELLVQVSKELLTTTRMSIAEIAVQLTYDPSNFTKFFKHYTGTTPKKYRDQNS